MVFCYGNNVPYRINLWEDIIMTQQMRNVQRFRKIFLNTYFLSFVFWISIFIMITKGRSAFTIGEFVIALLISVIGLENVSKFWRDSYK